MNKEKACYLRFNVQISLMKFACDKYVKYAVCSSTLYTWIKVQKIALVLVIKSKTQVTENKINIKIKYQEEKR